MRSKRKSKWSAVVWMILIVSTISMIVSAALHQPPVESGPGALSALMAIPNIVVIILCSVILIVLLLFHPAFELLSQPLFLVSIALWILIEVFLVNLPWLWGYYSFHIHVTDWQGKALPNIKVQFEQTKNGMSIEQAFLSNEATVGVTDEQGNVVYRANNYQIASGFVNGPGDGGNKALGDATFRLTPVDDRQIQLEISWTAKGQRPFTNERWYTTFVNRPYAQPLTIILPDSGGANESPYPPAQKPR
jgi:hypothetical protein